MAKSLRSKIKRRYRKAKRHYVEGKFFIFFNILLVMLTLLENIVADRVNTCYKKVQSMLCGLPVDQPRLKVPSFLLCYSLFDYCRMHFYIQKILKQFFLKLKNAKLSIFVQTLYL
jgi:hypothetical protein